MTYSYTLSYLQKCATTLILCLAGMASLWAQSPDKMSYQAVIRDASSNLITNQAVGMQISILQGSASGTAVYVETQTPSTNANGLVSIEIGAGTLVSGNFSMIDWTNGPYYFKTETDPAGGTNYSISGTTEFLSVPYALYAENSGSSLPGPQGPQGEQGPKGDSGLPDDANSGDLITFDGTNWVDTSIVLGNAGGGQAFNNMQPYLAVNYIICLQGVYPSRNSQEGFIGEIKMFGGNFAPRSWAFCEGQLLSIASNTALFSILGTTYGGDGRTTFGLPDFRGRVSIHQGTGPGLPTYRLGAKGGSPTTTLNILNMPAHNHTIIYQ